MKELFGILNVKTGKVVDNKYYDNKMVAKQVRNDLRDQNPGTIYLLTPGPDHHKFRG